MADDDHSLLLLDFLNTIEICSHRVVLERVHLLEELNEKVFWAFSTFKVRNIAHFV